jgi:endonuclease YncB( thermonuclease family)
MPLPDTVNYLMLSVVTDGKRVRLIGVDAPEIGQTCSSEATRHLVLLIEEQKVYLEKDVS